MGHDWGAVAGYTAARIDPDAFSKLVAMAVPPGFDPLALDAPCQLLRSWYVGFFQVPVAPARALRWRNFAFVDYLWNRWSPDWEYPDARINDVKETFHAGKTVENALQCYRDAINLSRSSFVGDRSSTSASKIRMPTLVVRGEDDGCIAPAFFEHAGGILDDWQLSTTS